MDTETLLTKNAILNGSNDEHMIEVTSLGGNVMIRPLTSGQWAKIEAIRTRGLTVAVDGLSPDVLDSNTKSLGESLNQDGAGVKIDMNMEALTEANFEADAYAVSCGLVGNWSVAEVRNIRPPAAIEEIAKEIYRISDVTPEDMTQIATFRDE